MTAKLSWFERELGVLRSSPFVNVVVHATRPGNEPKPLPIDDPEFKTSSPNDSLPTTFEARSEKVELPSVAIPLFASLGVHSGRPNIPAIIKEVVLNAGQHERVVVAGCGPVSLMDATRQGAAACISTSGPSIDLHLEQFGW